MKTIMAYLKRPAHMLATAALLCCALTSCNGVIYDDEGDCAYTYKVRFRYDLNMKWADAFASEVTSVHLYAFSPEGVLVWHREEAGETLAADGYAMTLDVAPGDYKLLAWCGLNNGPGADESFRVPEVREGSTTLQEMQCRLERTRDNAGAYSDKRLYSLFHGTKDVQLPDLSAEGGSYTCTIPLTKDTNHVRIILQHMSGEPVDPDDFTFTIEEENGLMAHDNSLLGDEMITYRAHNTSSGTAGLGLEDYPELGKQRLADAPSSGMVTSVSVAIADLTIPRLTEGRKTYLSVKKKNGEYSARIPLADYALLLKEGYPREMGDQEFLDRQDEWALTFFLNENDRWIATSIIVNAWRIVFNDVNFGQ